MSSPQGYNALVMALNPWKSFLRTATTVTTTATAIPATALANRAGLWVFNAGTVSCFIGDSTVGTSSEFILFSNQMQLLPFSDQVTLYGRVASESIAVISWEYTI